MEVPGGAQGSARQYEVWRRLIARGSSACQVTAAHAVSERGRILEWTYRLRPRGRRESDAVCCVLLGAAIHSESSGLAAWRILQSIHCRVLPKVDRYGTRQLILLERAARARAHTQVGGRVFTDTQAARYAQAEYMRVCAFGHIDGHGQAVHGDQAT